MALRLLTSWKEIASYLGKSIRTVQRWERELGLPVRRPNRHLSGIVIVDQQELDAWLAAMPLQPKSEAHTDSAAGSA
jgi:hypothetical protein